MTNTSTTKTDPTALLQAIDGAVTRVRTKALDFSFNELFDMYKSKELIIEPEFQRLFRWKEIRQSQFIESLILELPIPPIYVIEIEDGKYELIDGLQRLSSYFHFRGTHPSFENEVRHLRLEGCDILRDLNGLVYDELPSSVQIRLKRQSVRTEVLRRESDKRLRYYMFKRLNTGGERLSEQEIRNCTIRLLDNTFNAFLKKMTENADYVACMTELTDEKREQLGMDEYVLRFFGMKNNRKEYEKNVGEFLTEYMEAVSDPERKDVPFNYEQETKVFANTFRVLNEALGAGAFSGVNKQGNFQGYFSALHFEALAMGVQTSLDKLASADAALKGRFKEKILEVKKDAEFQKLTKGGGKNYAAALEARIDFVSKRVAECLQ
ncbi:MAG: DUF262 domain-containing protein [Labilithrix sp.]|nr:DUF262 domain-containing protein [Labilithrix sp.]